MTKEEAIKIIKKNMPSEKSLPVYKALETLIPELIENEDERIRKEIISALKFANNGGIYDKHIAYLEKQKVEELSTRLNGLMQEYIKAGKDEEEQEHRLKCYKLFWDALEDSEFFEQKENPKSAKSISLDYTSDTKCENRWHKVEDSLPDNGRLVLANDCLGNTLLARYDGEGNWEVSVYDNEDYYCRNTITKWCEIPSEKQKEQKPKFYPGDVIKCTSTGSLWVRCKGGDNIRSDGHTACIGGGFELVSEEEAVQFFQELNENGYQWDCIKGRPVKKEQKYWKPTKKDVALFNKVVTTNRALTPTERAHLDIIRSKFGYCHAVSCSGIVQKEQKPVDDKAFEEWIDDWWKHNKVNNPDSYDKGDEIQFDERGFKNFCRGIRNMYQPKPQSAEWSEEDEKMRLEAIKRIDELEFLGIPCNNVRNVLESLRPQPSRNLTISFMNYLDGHRPDGKMCLSNAECEDIDKAFKESDWEKILRYAEKYEK